jgi:hypothetical protein
MAGLPVRNNLVKTFADWTTKVRHDQPRDNIKTV